MYLPALEPEQRGGDDRDEAGVGEEAREQDPADDDDEDHRGRDRRLLEDLDERPMPSRRLTRAMTNAPNAPTAPAYVAGK